MAKSAETVLERIGKGALQVLKWLMIGVGYVFYGLSVGLGWIGRVFSRLGGKEHILASKERTRKIAPTETRRSDTVFETAAEERRDAEMASEPKPEPELEKSPEIDIATTRAEILAVIESAPYTVFPKDERRLMEGILTLRERPVRDLMIPKDKIVYVDSAELLGPMTLDRLYRSNLRHFPVKNKKGEVIGAVHTSSLNSLEVKESFRAGEILDPNIYYIREDYTIMEALDAFLRNDCYFCLVVNNYGKVVGMVSFDDLMKEIFGELKIDDFKRDNDALAVAKRRFPVEIA